MIAILYGVIFLAAQWIIIFGVAKLIDCLNAKQEWYKNLGQEDK